MIILGVDTETTGLNPGTCEVVELGVVLFDTERSVVINSCSRILPVVKWDDGAAKVHGIPQPYSISAAQLTSDPWDIIDGERAEIVVAHNAQFDKDFVVPLWPSFNKRTWLCTKLDLEHDAILGRGPAAVKTYRLGHLAVEYGIPVTGWHRAVTDAEICCRIAAKHDLKAAIERKRSPRYRLEVRGAYKKKYNDGMSEYRFRWDGEKKLWWKEGLLKEAVLEEAKRVQDLTEREWECEVKQLPPRPY